MLFRSYPRPTDRSQDYDFRPRKGSSLIDAGEVIPGINDGQNLQFNWPPSYTGQNRKYVGDAPDIGAYEYGDSVYWIPGYRRSEEHTSELQSLVNIVCRLLLEIKKHKFIFSFFVFIHITIPPVIQLYH